MRESIKILDVVRNAVCWVHSKEVIGNPYTN